jgi:hypothetical protein
MCLPSFENLISEIEAIISVKKDLDPGASCCSNLHQAETYADQILLDEEIGPQSPKVEKE